MKANQSNAGVVPSIIVPEVLQEDNYERWCILMQHYLVVQDLRDVLSIEMPQAEDPRDWVKKNDLALYAIKISCGAKSFDRIKKMNLAKYAWNALADLHKQPNEDESRGSETKTEVEETCPRISDNNKRNEIVSSLRGGDWDALKNLDTITEIIFPGGFTVLHIATTLGHVKIVKELVKIAREDYLEIQDENGDTALSLAAYNGKLEMAECLVQKNDKLLTIPNKQGSVPLVVACVNSQKDMASYLYSTTKLELLLPENSNQGTLFLKYYVLNFMPDVGLDLYLHCPRLATSREFITISELSAQPSLFPHMDWLSVASMDWFLYKYLEVVELPSPSDEAASTSRREIFKRQVARVKAWDRNLRFSFFLCRKPTGAGKLSRIYNLKLTHRYVNSVLHYWCKEILIYRHATQLVESGAISAIFQAIKYGTSKIVIEILNANPDLIWCNEKLLRDILTSAIKCRRGDILKFVYRLDVGKKAFLSLRDKDGNNALHLVAKLPDLRPSSHENNVDVHAAWVLMQHEEKWFKEVKSCLPCWHHEAKNHYGETPDQVFNREHQELRKKAVEWGKKTAESYTIPSVLIVTIMFAALFTVPGGNNENTGTPILLHKTLFSKFLICDELSFLTASFSLLVFLSILTMPYSRRGLCKLLPFQMMSAIVSLTISMATMILAFMFAFLMISDEKRHPALIILLVVDSFLLSCFWEVPIVLILLFKNLLRDSLWTAS